MPQIISAAYHRNGVCGEGFFVAVVRDLYDDERDATYMVTHVPDSDDEKSDEMYVANTKTFVVCTDRLPDVRFGINSFRGDEVPASVIEEIKEAARENHYEGRLEVVA
jgi:hypothetical protein